MLHRSLSALPSAQLHRFYNIFQLYNYILTLKIKRALGRFKFYNFILLGLIRGITASHGIPFITIINAIENVHRGFFKLLVDKTDGIYPEIMISNDFLCSRSRNYFFTFNFTQNFTQPYFLH